MGHNSPAIKQTLPIENDSIEPFMKIHITRIIGLKMLNEIGIHSQDSLPVLFFNLPESIPTRKYTYRANMSMAPDDYKQGLTSVNTKMLVLVGSKDEAFNAEIMSKVVTENSLAKVQIIDGASHNGIRHNSQAFKIIKNWFLTL